MIDNTNRRQIIHAKKFGVVSFQFENNGSARLDAPRGYGGRSKQELDKIQRQSPHQPQEAKAKPGAAEMKRLGFYPGEWTYTETYPNGAVNHGTYTSKLGPGGNSLLNTFHSQGPVGDFEGMLVYTWKSHGGKVQSLCVWQ